MNHPLAVGAWQMPNLSMPTSVSRTARAHHGAGRYFSATGPPPPPFSLYPEDLAAMMTGAHPGALIRQWRCPGRTMTTGQGPWWAT